MSRKQALKTFSQELHISHSQIFTYLNCSQNYRFKYIEGLPPERISIALPFGSAIHAAIELYYRGLKSSSAPMLWNGPRDSYIIIESELDGILLNQEAGDLVSVIALGSVNIRPDLETHEELVKSRRILVSLDFDKAGIKRSRQWWLKMYPQSKRWPVPVGKDPGEAFQQRLNLRKWIEAESR